MRSVISVVVLAACSGKPAPTKPPPAPAPAQPVSPASFIAEPVFVATQPAPDPPPPLPRPTPKTLAPGLYPVIVWHGFDNEPYLLGCGKVDKGKRQLLSPKACAPLIKETTKLELVRDQGPALPVTVTGSGKGSPCPADAKLSNPSVKLAGLPPGNEGTPLIIGVGLELYVGPLEEATSEAIASKHPVEPSKRPGPPPSPAPDEAMQLDLDGDGVWEVITEALGRWRIYRADGTILGELGCAFG